MTTSTESSSLKTDPATPVSSPLCQNPPSPRIEIARPRRSTDFVGRRVADEYVLVPVRRHASEGASIYTLNPVAGRIWELWTIIAVVLGTPGKKVRA